MKAFSSSIAAASLLAFSVTSAAAPPAALPLRDAAPVEEANDMGSSWVLVAAIAVAVGVLFFVILDDDDDEEPASP